jgi:hypothetical protein
VFIYAIVPDIDVIYCELPDHNIQYEKLWIQIMYKHSSVLLTWFS